MISKAISDYLTGTEPITGAPATAFRAPQTVGDFVLTDREDARRFFRDQVPGKLHAGRVPRGKSSHTAVTLKRIATNRVDEVTGGTTLADAIIQVDVWTRYHGAAIRGEIVANLIRVACEGFAAGNWGDIPVHGCEVTRESEFVEEPDQGDDWTHRYTMDLRVFYDQPSAVV